MNLSVNVGDQQILLGPMANPEVLGVGQQIEGMFRFGCSYARLAKDGRHAWVMDLYQRKAIVTGKALASEIPKFPSVDSVVRVKGQILANDDGLFLWVRELSSATDVSTEICALDLVTPAWVVDQGMVMRYALMDYTSNPLSRVDQRIFG